MPGSLYTTNQNNAIKLLMYLGSLAHVQAQAQTYNGTDDGDSNSGSHLSAGVISVIALAGVAVVASVAAAILACCTKKSDTSSITDIEITGTDTNGKPTVTHTHSSTTTVVSQGSETVALKIAGVAGMAAQGIVQLETSFTHATSTTHTSTSPVAHTDSTPLITAAGSSSSPASSAKYGAIDEAKFTTFTNPQLLAIAVQDINDGDKDGNAVEEIAIDILTIRMQSLQAAKSSPHIDASQPTSPTQPHEVTIVVAGETDHPAAAADHQV